MAGIDANGNFIFNDSNSSLAGFGYQDPLYDPYDGMSKPGTYSNYNSSAGSVLSTDPLNAIQEIAQKNNNWSAQQAAQQNAFQVEQNEKAMRFSAEQAALNRSWQEEMSNTAHQREVIDLKNAGLNPVLSANGGNGATVGSGAMASGVTSAGAKGDTDESSTMAFMSYMAQLLQAQTSILNTQTSANATLANAQLMADASMYGSEISALASRYGSELAYDSSLNEWDRYATYNIRRGFNDVGYDSRGYNSAHDVYYDEIPSDGTKAEKFWREKLGDAYHPVSESSKSSGSSPVLDAITSATMQSKDAQSGLEVIGKYLNKVKNVLSSGSGKNKDGGKDRYQ